MRYPSRRGFWAPEGMAELAIGALLLGISAPPFLRGLHLISSGATGGWTLLFGSAFFGLIGLVACILGVYQGYRAHHPRKPKK